MTPVDALRMFGSGLTGNAKQITDARNEGLKAKNDRGWLKQRRTNDDVFYRLLNPKGKYSSFSRGNIIKGLKWAGFTPWELTKDGDFSIKELHDNGFQVRQLLLNNDYGFTARELLEDGGLTVKNFKDDGFTAKELWEQGCSIEQLASAGFSAHDMKRSDFTYAQLREKNVYSDKVLHQLFGESVSGSTGYTAEELISGGAMMNPKRRLESNTVTF